MKNQALDTGPWLNGVHHQIRRYTRLRALIRGHQNHDIRGRILHYHRQQNDKDALMKGLNKQDKMSTQRIQLNPVITDKI